MECSWINVNGKLWPHDPHAEDVMRNTPNNAQVTTSEPKTRRHIEYHKWAMAVLHTVVLNTDHYASVDDLIFDLKVRSRMFKEVKYENGKVFAIPVSISFAAMSEQKFRRVIARWMEIITTEIWPGVDIDALSKEATRAIS